ncbi:hypothetical protein [Geminocystis herdmanii]|uniref:hypothetical protein n=1 Tax=Geminocystis herdmanii TaxID=669359 RepID=UPI00034A2CC6|nr:hypothetical protein [Geminocystis herdmanii]
MTTLQNILNKHCLEQKTGLLLLSMPTGFGKTHNVLDFIYHNYQEFKAQKRKFIFITNLKKNLPYQDLQKRFIRDHRESEYEENVLFINSNLDFVIDNLLNLEYEIPEDFKNSKKYQNLTKQIKKLQQIKEAKQFDSEFQQWIKDKIKDEYEPSFRYEIIEKLKQKCKKKEGGLELIKNDRNYQWIGKLYPTVFTDERTVLFMSMDKFLLKNSTLVEPAYYCFDRLAKNALIFIDEFDATKDTILNQIIDAGNKHKIDLINLFLNIHNHLKNTEFPESLLKDSEKRDKSSQNKNWKSLPEIITELKRDSQQIFEKFKLEYTYKYYPSEKDNSKKTRNFLFYDYESHHVLDRRCHLIIDTDQDHKSNWIKKSYHNSDDYKEHQTISYLLGQIAGFLTYFQGAIRILAENYYNLKKDDAEEVFSLESAISTVLNVGFKLDEKNINILTKNILENYNPFAPKTGKQINQLQSFYEVGFKYHDIVDNDNHDLTSKIYFYNFNQTPEGFLMKICSQAMVVGISATASMDTNIGNYDIKFLKQYLKNSFYSLSEDEINQLKNEYKEITKGYNQIEIKTKFIGTESQYEALERLEEIVDDEECANTLLTQSQGNEYVFCRYVRLLEAWQYFNQNEDCQAFICFLNKFPKEGDAELDLKIINKYFCYVNGFDADKNNLKLIKKQYVILNSENFDQKLNKLKERLAQGERIFIISTYQTLGAGVNLQYEKPKDFTTIKINDFDKRLEMDINGVYLEKPTHLLISLNNEEKNQDENFIKYLFQLEFLLENGVMSREQFKSKLDEAFHKYIGESYYRIKHEAKIDLYKTTPLTKYLNKVIIQALGRICRTNMKASTIHILADNSIKKYLNRVKLPSDIIPVKEYEALIENCQEYSMLPEEIKEAKIKAETNSHQAFQYIQRQLNNAYKSWNTKDIEKWKSLREQVLSQPTIVNKLDCENQWFKIYIDLPKSNNYYRFTQTNDYGEVEIFFDNNEGEQKVSETSARLPELMKIEPLKQLFIEKNYATNFEKAELIISPPIFNNIYKGALGEVCGKYILEEYCKIELSELDDHEFERFDFKTANGIYFDFKYWGKNFDKDAESELEKIRGKMNEINAKKVFIINILADTDNRPFNPISSDDNQIIRIPFLCQNNQISEKALHYLRQELN